jgi:hypothetical protein
VSYARQWYSSHLNTLYVLGLAYVGSHSYDTGWPCYIFVRFNTESNLTLRVYTAFVHFQLRVLLGFSQRSVSFVRCAEVVLDFLGHKVHLRCSRSKLQHVPALLALFETSFVVPNFSYVSFGFRCISHSIVCIVAN